MRTRNSNNLKAVVAGMLQSLTHGSYNISVINFDAPHTDIRSIICSYNACCKAIARYKRKSKNRLSLIIIIIIIIINFAIISA